MATCLLTEQCYVGFDKNWPNRQNDHLIESFNKNKKNYWYEFHKAIRNFGIEMFEWTILYQSPDGENTLKQMEPHFIKKFNSYYKWPNGGFNMTLGGDGMLGWIPSNKTRQLWSDQRSGELSNTFGLFGENHPAYGYHHTPEHLQYLSTKMQGNNYGVLQGRGSENKRSKPYTFYKDLQPISFIGLRQFCRDNNLDQGAMTRVWHDKQLTHKGYSKYACSD